MTNAAVIDRVPTAKVDITTQHLLTTERLMLRVVEITDFEHYRTLMTNPQVMKHIGIEEGKLPTDDEIKAVVDNAVTAWNTRGYGRWSVFDRVTNEFVGFAGFRCEGGVPELIVIVHERYWGNGYAVEAGQAVLDHGFSKLGFKVVCAFTRPANERAISLLERLGAESTGMVNFHGVEGAAYRIHPKP
ncbi:MAG: GNAT family N-acetyltransferase [Pyrinomonadaceae bacterium]